MTVNGSVEYGHGRRDTHGCTGGRTSSAPILRQDPGHGFRLLGVDSGSNEEWLRSIQRGRQDQQEGLVFTPVRVHPIGGGHPERAGIGSLRLREQGVLQPGASASGHTSREPVAGRHSLSSELGQDPLSSGARIHSGEHAPEQERENIPNVPDVSQGRREGAACT